ncbi:hypothetical protein [Methylocystis sp.]|uniref:hypothetical protein n=1 Tax=Methylocystis sp. TaxID=1911079 RepID=UPI003D0D9707
MDSPFSSPKALHARAQAHIREFSHKAHSQFLDRKPYLRASEMNPHTREQLLKLRFTKEIPPELPCIAFDAINCLRSALDHSVYDASRVIKQADVRFTKFPVGKTRDEAENEFSKPNRAIDVPPCIRDYILDFKPYKEGGNRLLWGLNEIRNAKIHRTLAPVGGIIDGLGISNGYIGTMVTLSEWDAEKNELTYASIQECRDLQLQVSVDIAFAQSTEMARIPVIGALRDVSSIVASVIDGLEAETARILSS